MTFPTKAGVCLMPERTTEPRDTWRRLAEDMAVGYYLLILAQNEPDRLAALERLQQGAKAIGDEGAHVDA